MDHGKIITKGTPQDLKKKTGTSDLEEAFLKLTGSSIRDEDASGVDMLRTRVRARGRI